MRECITHQIRHQMTEEQLVCFLVANGLRRDGNQLLAPEGEVVGVITRVGRGPQVVTVFEEKHRRDGCEVTAWWPAFRPAWTLLTPDGGVEVGETLGPDEVICDLCNAEVAIRPVPVVGGYAHCANCFVSLGVPFPGSVCPYCVLSTGESEEANR